MQYSNADAIISSTKLQKSCTWFKRGKMDFKIELFEYQEKIDRWNSLAL